MGEIVQEGPDVGVADRNGAVDNNNTVEVILRTVGPARPSHLRVPSTIKVRPSLSLSLCMSTYMYAHIC